MQERLGLLRVVTFRFHSRNYAKEGGRAEPLSQERLRLPLVAARGGF